MSDVKELAPGRELDRRVAEKMGKYVHEVHTRLLTEENLVVHVMSDTPAKLDEYWSTDILPNYSTDIAAAWELVGLEKLVVVAPETVGELWTVGKLDDEGQPYVNTYHYDIYGEATTAPHAICLAFLNLRTP